MSELHPIVFIPGLLCDESLWQAQIKYFAGRRPISVFVATEDDSVPAMARRLLDGAPERFILCGLSMGGYIAMEVMRQAPQRVVALILADTSPRLDSDEQKQHRLDMIRLAGRGSFKGVSPRLLSQWVAPASLEKPEIGETVSAMSSRLGKDVYIRQQTAILSRIDSRLSLTGISCPTLVIVGRLDQVTPLDVAEEMASLIPGAKLEVIEGAAHLPPIEQPKAFTLSLESFIKFV